MKKIKLTEDKLSQIVQKVLKEQNETKFEPITINLIKEYIITALEGYDLSNKRTRRRLSGEIEQLAKDYYDKFIDRLVYITEDGDWKTFLERIEY